MSEFPTQAKVVVIGAGIVGNCLVGHLARLGWEDIVLLDKGPLPNPGGSTAMPPISFSQLTTTKKWLYLESKALINAGI